MAHETHEWTRKVQRRSQGLWVGLPRDEGIPQFCFVLRLSFALLFLSLAGCAVPVQSPRASAAYLIKIDPQSEWVEFADYFRDVIATVEARWFAILDESRVAPHSGTRVVVTFSLNIDGVVTILKTEGDAGRQGIYACTSALTARPIGKKWTDAMVAKLGHQQTLTFAFFYQ